MATEVLKISDGTTMDARHVMNNANRGPLAVVAPRFVTVLKRCEYIVLGRRTWDGSVSIM